MWFQKKHEFRPDKAHSGTVNKLYITKKQRLSILKWTLMAAALVLISVLQDVILQMRRFLIEKGTSFYFHTKLEELCIERGKLIGIRTSQGYFDCEVLVLAIGHSARDTFVMLKENKLPMEAKNFAVGFRVEHPQQMMNEALYGKQRISLPAAPYKVTANFPNQRGREEW